MQHTQLINTLKEVIPVKREQERLQKESDDLNLLDELLPKGEVNPEHGGMWFELLQECVKLYGWKKVMGRLDAMMWERHNMTHREDWGYLSDVRVNTMGLKLLKNGKYAVKMKKKVTKNGEVWVPEGSYWNTVPRRFNTIAQKDHVPTKTVADDEYMTPWDMAREFKNEEVRDPAERQDNPLVAY